MEVPVDTEEVENILLETEWCVTFLVSIFL